jgi:hypothetical protein
MYLWGKQSGKQASKFLKEKSLKNIKMEMVEVRRRVFNSEKAKRFLVEFGEGFIEVK